MPANPLPVVLYPKRTSVLLYLAGSAVFVGISVALIVSGRTDNMETFERWTIYAGLPFFGICMAVFAAQLLPGSTYLRLEEKGFTFCNLFQETAVEWKVIERVFPLQLKQGLFTIRHIVAFDYVAGSKPRGADVSQAMTGCDGALPDTYGMKAADLARLMEEVRRQRTAADS